MPPCRVDLFSSPSDEPLGPSEGVPSVGRPCSTPLVLDLSLLRHELAKLLRLVPERRDSLTDFFEEIGCAHVVGIGRADARKDYADRVGRADPRVDRVEHGGVEGACVERAPGGVEELFSLPEVISS